MNISSLYNNMFSDFNKINSDPLSVLQNTTQPRTNIPQEGESSFSNIISNEIEKLNTQQVKADEMVQGFISGQVDDLHTVMIATEEARLSLELAVQIRNRCVEAYKEINNMQL